MADFERDSGWLSGQVVDAEDARLATGVLAAAAADPGNLIAARTGLRPGPGNPSASGGLGGPGGVNATTTVSRNVTVSPFQGIVQGTRASAAGAYLITLGQQKTLDVLTAAPADSSKQRIALVVARQTDRQYGDASDGMLVQIVAGAPGTPPVAPAVTGDCLTLAEITIAPNAASVSNGDIKDRRVYTVAAGGVLPLQADESLPADGYPGQRLYDLETGLDLVRRGTSWRPATTGAIEFFGPADTGWPTQAGSAGASAFTFNQVTVPAAPYPRLLFVTGQVIVQTSGTDERWDHIVRGTDGALISHACFHGGPTKLISSVASGHRLLPASTTPYVMTESLIRGGNITTGTASVWSTAADYTGLRVVAFPVP
ncbi:hypothetical protein ACGF3G_17015 [Streptomyces sp. NPDC048179]|uniref:hypothetical protein n=1 Tax=Streptomyces sp. NPDC048179 TaxID=3365506 RepID=UPI003712445C